MKKLLTTIALLLCLISNAQYSCQYFISDNGPVPGGFLLWQYSWNSGITNLSQNIL